jgi:hypothetical protein
MQDTAREWPPQWAELAGTETGPGCRKALPLVKGTASPKLSIMHGCTQKRAAESGSPFENIKKTIATNPCFLLFYHRPHARLM